MSLESYDIFKILGVESRIKIIELLKQKGPLGAKTIAQELQITPAAVSQHLKILKHAGFVNSERHGFHIPYSLNEKAMDNCHHQLTDVCNCGCPEQHPIQKQKYEDLNIAALKEYKEQLQNELALIENKIKNIEKE